MTDTISFMDAVALISPDGRRQVVELVQKACDERGAGYLEAIKDEYPSLYWIAELAANNDAETCVRELEKEFSISLGLLKKQICDLHAEIRNVIDRPRG